MLAQAGAHARRLRAHAAALSILTASATALGAPQEDARALLLDIEGAIGPATAEYVTRGIEQAEDERARLAILRMDTPGGLDHAMREIIKAILASNVPVVSFVAPTGSRAASAGTYIMYASHVAAMAPATTLGAATPVQIGGGGLPGTPSGGDESPQKGADQDRSDKAGKGQDEGEGKEGQAAQPSRAAPKSAMERKMVNDAAAYIKGLAERHGRNAEWAQRAVREAVSLNAREALEKNVVDVVADGIPALLEQLDGREIRIAGATRVLATQNLEIERLEPGWRSELLSVITDPNVAYILMLIGIYGLIFELASPGAVFPGVAGAICLLLALYAFQALPINYAGLGLIVLGIVCMVGEAFMPSFGVLGIGGVIAFVAGSVMLLDREQLAISLPLIGGTALVSASFFMWVIARLLRIRRTQVVSGSEQMVGMIGRAVHDFDASGHVRVHSETWSAHTRTPIKAQQRIRVTSMQGLTLNIEPAQEEDKP